MRRFASAFILCALAAAPATVAAQDVDNTAAWDGSSYISSFGKTNTATYGQTFTVGSETYLNSFDFWLRYGAGGTDLLFSAYIGEWTGSNISSVVWSSDETNPYAGPTTADFRHYSFGTGGLGLNAGATYVAFLSASQHFDEIASSSATAYMGRTTNPEDSYSGGHFVYLNNGSNFSQLSTSNWTQWTNNDAAFRADFSATGAVAVPEPGALLLLSTGILGLFGLALRRRSEGLDPA